MLSFIGVTFRSGSSVSGSSTIPTGHMELIVQKLLGQQNRRSTVRTYVNIWRQFNNFVLSLDQKPPSWEARTTLYIAYLIDNGRQSASIKTYVSAIKKLLVMDGYKWKDNEVLLNSLTKACRMINDRVKTRLPIQCGFLEMILFEVGRHFAQDGQYYLEWLYKALFTLCYYGMMRIGEVTESPHVLKARNVHIATNKDKLLVVLYTSKTHGLGQRPQKIKITSNRREQSGQYSHRHFCPFEVLRKFIKMRGGYSCEQEQFFVFRGGNPVKPAQATKVLKLVIDKLGLNSKLYSMHSFHIGRTIDLIKYNYPLEVVQRMGRWKSNAVLHYIRS